MKRDATFLSLLNGRCGTRERGRTTQMGGCTLHTPFKGWMDGWMERGAGEGEREKMLSVPYHLLVAPVQFKRNFAMKIRTKSCKVWTF